MSIEGRWRIVEMELWDRDAIELLGPAFIEIGEPEAAMAIRILVGADLHARR
jgi:hypothetical protein